MIKDFLRHPQVRGDEDLAKEPDLQQAAQDQDHPVVQTDQPHRDTHGLQPTQGMSYLVFRSRCGRSGSTLDKTEEILNDIIFVCFQFSY